jgi:ComF family protein
MSPLPTRLAAMLLPQDCFLCGAAAGAELLCAGCLEQLPRLGKELCPVCALPSPGAAVCGDCLKHPPHFDATLAIYVYDFPLDRLIHALKYRAALEVIPFLGASLAACAVPEAELIVPVPLHPLRLKERGFNQALELARFPARRWSVPLDFASCSRSRNAPAQVSLPRAERQRNVRHAFLCEPGIGHSHVVVIDDVMTSGATLNEFALALKKAGARRVTNLVVARAV